MPLSVDQILNLHKAKKTEQKKYAQRVFFKSIGIPETGIGYIYLFRYEDYDRENKINELRKYGYRWNDVLKAWLSASPSPTIQTTKIDFTELIEFGWDDRYHFNDLAPGILIDRYMQANNLPKQTTGFYGLVGERIQISVTFNGQYELSSDSDFGNFNILYFSDDEGHKFSWFQRTYSEKTIRKFMKLRKVKKLTISGKIKRHTTRLGVQYTELTRCEISANGYLLHDFAAKEWRKSEGKK